MNTNKADSQKNMKIPLAFIEEEKVSAIVWFILFLFSVPGDDGDVVFVDLCQRFWTHACLSPLMEEWPGSGIKHLEV